MSVERIVTIANKIANGKPVQFPAMTFSDWDLLTRCIREAKSSNNQTR